MSLNNSKKKTKNNKRTSNKKANKEYDIGEDFANFCMALEFVVSRLSIKTGKKVLKAVQAEIEPELRNLGRTIKESQDNFG